LAGKPPAQQHFSAENRISSLQRIARVEQALAHGHPTTTGIIDDLTRIEHRDGTHAVWHRG
jgi:hypothetical protein